MVFPVVLLFVMVLFKVFPVLLLVVTKVFPAESGEGAKKLIALISLKKTKLN